MLSPGLKTGTITLTVVIPITVIADAVSYELIAQSKRSDPRTMQQDAPPRAKQQRSRA